ncbi:MAG: hypothetical protein ACLTXH_05700 [Enterobacter hormaechei]
MDLLRLVRQRQRQRCPSLVTAFDNAKRYPENQPRVILCDTLMGKGVPFLEKRDKNHFIRVDADRWQRHSRAGCQQT